MKTKAEDIVPLIVDARSTKLQKLLRDVEMYNSDALTYERRAADALEEKKRCLRQAEEARAMVAKEEEGLEKVKEEASTNADTTLARLSKHALLESFEVKGNSLVLRTKLLFAGVRRRAGETRKKRTCIGAFEISFDLKPHYGHIKIDNLLYSRHWSIATDGSPCLGEWATEIQRLVGKQDIYGLFDLYTHYLRAADTDMAAYMRSHDWVKNYRYISHPPEGEAINRGDYVVCMIVEYDGRGMLGAVGRVESVDSRTIGVAWKDTYYSEDEDGEELSTGPTYWNVPKSSVVKITKDQFDAKDRYDIHGKLKGAVTAIDKLKDGATLDDALAIIKDKKVTQITLK